MHSRHLRQSETRPENRSGREKFSCCLWANPCLSYQRCTNCSVSIALVLPPKVKFRSLRKVISTHFENLNLQQFHHQTSPTRPTSSRQWIIGSYLSEWTNASTRCCYKQILGDIYYIKYGQICLFRVMNSHRTWITWWIIKCVCHCKLVSSVSPFFVSFTVSVYTVPIPQIYDSLAKWVGIWSRSKTLQGFDNINICSDKRADI